MNEDIEDLKGLTYEDMDGIATFVENLLIEYGLPMRFAKHVNHLVYIKLDQLRLNKRDR